ncbi:MAG: Hsp20/alpha crystallin family protein [candidate division Zixibacteria bacterium]|nr:Hsp20/alpha crystallin family protein [candidate division Zixibacteria bacterium]
MRHLIATPNRVTRDIDSLFNSFFNVPSFENNEEAEFVPRVNIEETKDDISLTFELPGISRDNIKVIVKDDILTIAGERKSSKEDKDETFIRREICSGKFSRSFTLPETVNPESVSADFNNGLLLVKLGKKEEVKPREIEVKIS